MDDGHEEERVKWCPRLDKWCIGSKCALYQEMVRRMGGMEQKFGMCADAAVVMILSEINQKTQPPQQKIQLPNILRG